MNVRLYCPDIECDSCVRVIEKVLQKSEGIKNFKVNKDSVDVDFNQEQILESKIIESIKEKGYRVSLEPFERKTFIERFRDFWENKKKYENEYKMLKYSLFSFLALIAVEVLAYFAFFSKVPEFLSSYGWWIFYLNLSVVSVGAAMWHLKSYRAQVTSMTGMMIGMTTGMQTGMMIGTVISATNGLLVGGLVGMLLAVIVGFYNGKCCGIMGVMEGMMAGVMGGLMGAMIGVMFIVDNILIFMPFFMIINLLIMGGLSYMLFEELVEHNEKIKKAPMDFSTFFSYCFVAIFFLILVMIYGPKTGIAGVI